MEDLYLVKIPKDFKLDIENSIVKKIINDEVNHMLWREEDKYKYDKCENEVIKGIQNHFNIIKTTGKISWGIDEDDDILVGYISVIKILEDYNFVIEHFYEIKDYVQIINIDYFYNK